MPSRGRGNRNRNQRPNAARNPDGLGVGALASQPLQHGERGAVESLAAQPPPSHVGGGQQGQGPAFQRPDIDIMGPTQRPGEPLTAGLPVGPGAGPEGGTGAFDPDPDEVIRVAYSLTGHPDLLEILTRRM